MECLSILEKSSVVKQIAGLVSQPSKVAFFSVTGSIDKPTRSYLHDDGTPQIRNLIVLKLEVMVVVFRDHSCHDNQRDFAYSAANPKKSLQPFILLYKRSRY